VAEFLDSGGYDHHLRRIRRIYAGRVAAMMQAVRRFFPAETRVTRPGGGFVLWVQLPEAVDSLELYKLALQSGIALTPGYVFSTTDQFRHFIRLNAATWSAEGEQVMARLGQLMARLA
jgi:DNA-binding transcriptional MocR family regulator